MAECEGCGSSCTGSCTGGCSDTCTGTCTGTCTDACTGCEGCTGTCEGACQGACKGDCKTVAGINGGDVNWTNFSYNDTIIIYATDWNRVATGIFAQNGQSGILKNYLVKKDDPITANIYNGLYKVLYYNSIPVDRTNFDALAINNNGIYEGAISDATLITAEHFSTIGQIFNTWPLPQWDAPPDLI